MGWATVVSCDVACHVMSLDVLVMSFDAMWLVIACVASCHVMQCDVMWCALMWRAVICCAQYYSNTTLFYKVLVCTTNYYSSTTPYYKVILCTTKYYSSTTLYYKVLLQYYKVIEGTTAVLLQYYKALPPTTKYYSCTSHAPTSPNAAPATKSNSHDQSSWSMKRYLQCAKQHKASSNITKGCACHEKYPSWSILLNHAVLFTMREAAQVILQRHQMLRLPRK